jgi:FAD/FMN-containing dehydrogenase
MSGQETVVDSFAALSNAFSGDLLDGDAAGYDEARRLHNGLIDKRPALIARCQGTADVVDALRYARSENLEVAVRGGGHNVAGRATVDDGLMIDLSPMKGILVDPQQRTAQVQPGVTWAELNRETQLFGLAVTGGTISTTGVAGLTLGGGLGWLMGRYGLTCDNLLGAEIVTADGQVLHVAEDSHPDLLWALRGGGGNFGVVTSFLFRLHEVGPTVIGGMVAHPFSAARELFEFHREFTRGCPDELTVWALLLHAPDGSGHKLAAQVACYCGDPADGEELVRPLKEFAAPVMDTLGLTTYAELNTILDGAAPRGALNYWKSRFLKELDDEVIGTWIDQFSLCEWPMSAMALEHLHGEVVRKGVDETAFPLRQEGHNALILGQWADPAETERAVAWCRSAYAAMDRFERIGRYVNYLDEDESADAGTVGDMYGPNYQRLREVKARYDPENIFHLNQNIMPAGG